jgi:hypothetical protein
VLAVDIIDGVFFLPLLFEFALLLELLPLSIPKTPSQTCPKMRLLFFDAVFSFCGCCTGCCRIGT